MFKTILVPTDGSALSEKAVQAAVEFAKEQGGKLVALSVAEPYPFTPLSEMYATEERDTFEEHARAAASFFAEKIAKSAGEAGVACNTVVAQSFTPADEIISAATKFHCDAIFMASHGRKGLKGLLLGSETQKVLAHSKFPVLVFR